MLAVDKEFISKAGNLVKIVGREEIQDAPGEFTYTGQVTKPVKGHEALDGKLHKFNEAGAWLSYPGGVHDLVKEREKA